MDLEGEIPHGPLQQTIGLWEAELNGHPSKPPESFEKHVD
jgi:hypothetical protein